MNKIKNKMIEQARNNGALHEVEARLKEMTDKECVHFLEKLIDDVNAMNYYSKGNYINLQAVLVHAKKAVKENAENS